MNMVFTDEFLESFKSTDSPYDGKYIKNLSINNNLKFLREKIESAILKYPVEKRDSLIDNIRSFSDIVCRSNLAELYTFLILFDNYNSVEVEKPLDIVNNKTPDFWVNNQMAFEVFSLFEEDKPLEYAIKETINSVKTNHKIMLTAIKNIPYDGYPKLSEIRNYFIELFKDDNEIKPLTNFIHTFSQGIILSGKIYRGEKGHSTIGAQMSTSLITSYILTARKRIKEKIHKYRSLTKSGYPLIIVLYDYSDWLGLDDFNEILFGTEKYTVDLKTEKCVECWREDAIIRKDQNTSLSALLLKKKDKIDEYYLFENPYARVPVTDISKIKMAFKTENFPIE